MKYLILALFTVACSSTQERSTQAPAVKNEAFKKVKPLSANEVSGYYPTSYKTLNPALQDETLDRYSSSELSKMNLKADPLVEISVKCAQKDYKEAFAVAARNFNLYQKVAPYWNQIANCHLNQGAHRKALLFYNKALEVSPKFVPALNNIGVMYSRLGEDQKALVAFERANKESKFSKTPRYNLGKLYLTYGLADSALPIFQGLLNDSPKDVDVLNAVASSYFLMSDYGKALSYYQQIPQSQWEQAEIGLNLALTLKKLGKKKEALQVFDRVSTPKDEALRRYFGVIKNKLGEG
jgi:tetratricopeptide (TPR) repeat protein